MIQVVLLDEAGRPLETGDAVRAEGDWWEYAPRAEAFSKRILAQAFDLPGNCTKLEV
jgi:hypothetical protein